MSILQQTNAGDANTDDHAVKGGDKGDGPTVLEDVIDKAVGRGELEQEINGIYPVPTVRV